MSIILSRKVIGNVRIVTVLCVLLILMVTGYSFQAISNYIEHSNKLEQTTLQQQIESYRSQVASLSTEVATMKEEQQYLQMKLAQKQQTYTGKVMIEQDVGSVLRIEATAYVSTCPGCSGITKTGLDVRDTTPKLIAVDPSVVPLHKKVELIVGDKSLGKYMTEDIGSDIQGFRIDILMPTFEQAMKFGRQTVVLKIVE